MRSLRRPVVRGDSLLSPRTAGRANPGRLGRVAEVALGRLAVSGVLPEVAMAADAVPGGPEWRAELRIGFDRRGGARAATEFPRRGPVRLLEHAAEVRRVGQAPPARDLVDRLAGEVRIEQIAPAAAQPCCANIAAEAEPPGFEN